MYRLGYRISDAWDFLEPVFVHDAFERHR